MMGDEGVWGGVAGRIMRRVGGNRGELGDESGIGGWGGRVGVMGGQRCWGLKSKGSGRNWLHQKIPYTGQVVRSLRDNFRRLLKETREHTQAWGGTPTISRLDVASCWACFCY